MAKLRKTEDKVTRLLREAGIDIETLKEALEQGRALRSKLTSQDVKDALEIRARARAFEEEALSNADRVTARRCRAFITANYEAIAGMLANYAYAHGLTDYDSQCMLSRMRGDDRPLPPQQGDAYDAGEWLFDEELDKDA